jgi:hypothetical protein
MVDARCSSISVLSTSVATSDFKAWAESWIALAKYPGARLPDEEARITKLVELWHAPVPSGWERSEPDQRLLDPNRRYCRTHTGGDRVPRAEHALECDILKPIPACTATVCLGAPLVDGVNAVPLTKDADGGRAGNVEADMFLLTWRAQGLLLLLVEVKVESNNAWYAAVENLRQMKLFLSSATPRAVFHTRLPELGLPDDLPTTAVVLAPLSFYTAPGKKSAAVAPARRLLQRMSHETRLDAVLATWDPESRAIETYPTD